MNTVDKIILAAGIAGGIGGIGLLIIYKTRGDVLQGIAGVLLATGCIINVVDTGRP